MKEERLLQRYHGMADCRNRNGIASKIIRFQTDRIALIEKRIAYNASVSPADPARYVAAFASDRPEERDNRLKAAALFKLIKRGHFSHVCIGEDIANLLIEQDR